MLDVLVCLVCSLVFVATKGIEEGLCVVAHIVAVLGAMTMGCYVALMSKEPLEKVAELLGKVADLPGKATDCLLDWVYLALVRILRCLWRGVCGVYRKDVSWFPTT